VRRGEAEPVGLFEIVVDNHHHANAIAEAVGWVAPGDHVCAL
jgi:hypothetical protein